MNQLYSIPLINIKQIKCFCNAHAIHLVDQRDVAGAFDNIQTVLAAAANDHDIYSFEVCPVEIQAPGQSVLIKSLGVGCTVRLRILPKASHK